MYTSVLVWSVALILWVGAGTVAGAEEAPAPSKHDGDWYRLVHVDYKAGKTDDALTLISEHFAPAGAAAGTPGPVMSLVHESGPWNATWVWHLSGGPGDLEWDVSPNNLKWMAALAEQEGGMEQARQVLSQFSDLIASRTSYIVRGWSAMAEEADGFDEDKDENVGIRDYEPEEEVRRGKVNNGIQNK